MSAPNARDHFAYNSHEGGNSNNGTSGSSSSNNENLGTNNDIAANLDSDIPSELGTRSNTPLINFEEWVAEGGMDPFVNQPLNPSDFFAPMGANIEITGNHNHMLKNEASNNEKQGTTTITPLESFPPSLHSRSDPLPSEHNHNMNAPLSIMVENRKRNSPEESSSASSVAGESTASRSGSCFSRRKKKPKGMPKRPLSAYNLYFQAQRNKIQAEREKDGEENAKIGFEELGKIIGKLWRDLESAEKKIYEKLAEKDGERYRKEMDAYREMKNKRYDEEANRPLPTTSTNAASPLIVATALDMSSAGTTPLMNQAGYINGAPSSYVSSPHHGSVVFMSTVPGLQQAYGAPGLGVGAEGGAPAPSAALSCDPSVAPQGSGSTHPSPSQGIRQTSSWHGSHFFPQGTHSHPTLQSYPLAPSMSSPDGFNSDGNSNHFPLPPGMEIVLSDSHGVDRKYRVHYTCYSMTREAAHQYLDRLTGVAHNNGTNNGNQPPHPTADASRRPASTAPAPMQAHSQASMSQQHYNAVWGI
jgi:HMG (high mobility group) box